MVSRPQAAFSPRSGPRDGGTLRAWLEPSPRLRASSSELELAERAEILERLNQASRLALFAQVEPAARVDDLLVRLARTLGIAELRLQVGALLVHELLDRLGERPLRIGVDVHLDHAVGHGLGDLFRGRAGAAVEHEIEGLRARLALLFDELLRLD